MAVRRSWRSGRSFRCGTRKLRGDSLSSSERLRASAGCSTRSERNSMTGEAQLIDTNVLVHAYTVADDRKHQAAVSLVERVWTGEGAATTLQNVCEFFFVVTRKVARPVPVAVAEAVVQGILSGSQWRVIDRGSETVLKAVEMVRLYRAKFWDALIAASMLEPGVGTIVTENEQDFRKIPGITVVNPFKVGVQR